MVVAKVNYCKNRARHIAEQRDELIVGGLIMQANASRMKEKPVSQSVRSHITIGSGHYWNKFLTCSSFIDLKSSLLAAYPTRPSFWCLGCSF